MSLIGTPVYTDTSDALIGLPPERVYALIEKHGLDRVMFGSDYPLRTTRSAYDALMKPAVRSRRNGSRFAGKRHPACSVCNTKTQQTRIKNLRIIHICRIMPGFLYGFSLRLCIKI